MTTDSFGDGDDEIIASINMVPFIDISLVLLVIFMVTSAYIVRQAISVELPVAASGDHVAPSALALVISAEGEISLNGEVVSMEALPPLLRAEVAADAEVRAIIAGDRRVDYGVVIDVVDQIKLAGVAAFALNIEREPTR